MAFISIPPVTNASSGGIIKTVLQSSFIAAVEYDQANLTLTTHFKNGAIYQHKFVMPTEHTALITSQNHGKAWSTQIKGKKQGVKIRKIKAPRAEIKGRK